MHRLELSLLSVILVIVVLAGIQPTIMYGVEAPIAVGRILWHSYINPSRGKDVSYSVCGDGDSIYVVGSEAGGQGMPIPRVEKRLKADGSLLAVWKNESILGEFRDCAVLDGRLYAVGYIELEHGTRSWIMVVFDEDLTPLDVSVRREYKYWNEAMAISILGDSIYVAGFVGVDPSDIQWRIEKVSLNLSPILVYDVNPSNMYDILMCFDANPVTGDLWVVGINGLTGHWRIDVLDGDLNRKYVFEKEMPGYGLPNAIAFDENGLTYIAGAGIAVFNDRAELMHVTTTLGYCPKMVYSDGIIYLFCTSLTEGYNRHILYVIDKQSFIAFTSILSSNINAYAYFANGEVHLDERGLYVSGHLELEDSGGWIVYGIEKVPSQIPIEYVVTEPYTTTVTVTIGFKDLIEQIKRETPTYIITSETTPLQAYSPSQEVERKPPIDVKTILLVALIIAIPSVLMYFIARKK